MILDYSMMQWVLSIVVGISLSRFINTVALMGRKTSRIKFDFLLVSILFATTTNMIHWWFNSPDYFSNIEGKYIPTNYTCTGHHGTGCVCITKEQRDYLAERGDNA